MALKRKKQTMPEEVEKALGDGALRAAYDERPAYQRNDYLSWIKGAKTDATRRKRLDQMLSELRTGGVYMGMTHRKSAKGEARA